MGLVHKAKPLSGGGSGSSGSSGTDSKILFDSETNLLKYKLVAPEAGSVKGNLTIDPTTFELNTGSSEIETIYFAKKIDLTNISKVKCTGSVYSSYTTDMYISPDTTTITKKTTLSSNAYETIEIDVSDLSGEYYICFKTIIAHLKKIWLE